jgi:cytochrome d ubiquinol oxidase subunit I
MHMLFAAYAATGAGTAMVYALAMLRGRRDTYTRRGVLLGMAMAAIAAPIVGFFGDLNARVVANYQPAKFAAMESLFQTTRSAPETILGWPDPTTRQTYLAIRIPGLDSWLAFGDTNATVKGLDAFPSTLWPDIRIVHLSFDVMVGIGFLALGVGVWFWYRYYFKRARAFDSRFLLWLIAAMGPLTFLAIELGWTTTEMGRQPWVVYNYILTSQAVTPAPGLNISFLVFTAVYIALGVATTVFLLRLRQTERGTPSPREHIADRGGLQPAEGGA